jgi:hypothetical protein
MESNNIFRMYFILYIADLCIGRTFHFVYFQPVRNDVAFLFLYFLHPPSTSFIPFLLEVRVNICSCFIKSSFFIVSSLVVSISDINFSVSLSSLLYLTLIFLSHCFTGTLFKLFLLLRFLFLCSVFLRYCDV